MQLLLVEKRVPKVGLEPTHPHGYQILSLARLPFRHFGFSMESELKQSLSKFPNFVSQNSTDKVYKQCESSLEASNHIEPILVVMQQWSDDFYQS